MKAKMLIGKIKSNGDKDLKEIDGMKIIVMQIEDDDKCMIISPVEKEDIDKFYRKSYEDVKDLISDNFNYVIWYLLNEDSEFTCSININQLEDVKEATNEEQEKAYKNLDVFKFNHKFYNYEAAYKETRITKNLVDNINELDNTPIPKVKNENLKCFKIGIDEFEFIISHDLNSAIKFYMDTMIDGKELVEEGYTVEEISDWKELEVRDEEDENKVKTFFEYLTEDDYKYEGPLCLGTTCNY